MSLTPLRQPLINRVKQPGELLVKNPPAIPWPVLNGTFTIGQGSNSQRAGYQSKWNQPEQWGALAGLPNAYIGMFRVNSANDIIIIEELGDDPGDIFGASVRVEVDTFLFPIQLSYVGANTRYELTDAAFTDWILARVGQKFEIEVRSREGLT